MSKITKEGNVAADFWTYIDDIRSIDLSEEKGWVVGWRIDTYCTYLGIQDTTQKRRLTSMTSGPRAGSIITYEQND